MAGRPSEGEEHRLGDHVYVTDTNCLIMPWPLSIIITQMSADGSM